MIDVTTAGDDGHWDHADIKRLCEYRDRLKAALRLSYDFLTKTLGYDSHDFLVRSVELALGIPTLETKDEPDCSCEGIDSDTGLHTSTCVSRQREYHFDRYRNGRQMAQGAIVNAITEKEALAKAHALYRECPNDTFKLRPDDPNAAFRWICIHCTTVSGIDDKQCLGCHKPRYPLTASKTKGEQI